jgi:DNA phosphorothioation-dependent restriction protein DptG
VVYEMQHSTWENINYYFFYLIISHNSWRVEENDNASYSCFIMQTNSITVLRKALLSFSLINLFHVIMNLLTSLTMKS